MSVLNIFAQDAFSVMRLTDALREIKYTPNPAIRQASQETRVS